MAFRILVVEDDPVSRELVLSLLADRGFEIDTAEDGFNALRMAQERLYDLVLIDYHLPEMDGYALARLMRSLGEKASPGMKMIAVTADQFGLAARRGVDTIFDRMLSKPIDPVAFPALVNDILGPSMPLDALDDFFGPEPAETEIAAPSLGLWRARGLARIPAAVVFPTPTPAERTNIEHCFRVVSDPGAADCLLLLHAHGLAAIEDLRRSGRHFLLPLVALDEASAAAADVLFEPDNGDTWTAVAQAVVGFAARRGRLDEGLAFASAPEMRFLSFMLVCDRQFELHRSLDGRTIVPRSSGFVASDIAQATRALLKRGLVRATVHKDGSRIDVVTIEAKSSADKIMTA